MSEQELRVIYESLHADFQERTNTLSVTWLINHILSSSY